MTKTGKNDFYCSTSYGTSYSTSFFSKLFIPLLTVLLSPIFLFPSAHAEVIVQSLVDQNEITMDEGLTLTVSVSSSDSVKAGTPKIPDIPAFSLINSWTSASTSSHLVSSPQGMNFETQRRQDFNYMFAPKQKGTFTIGAFEVEVDEKTYTTKPITVRVLEAGAHQNAQIPNSKKGKAQRQIMPGLPPGFPSLDDFEEDLDDPFNQMLQQRGRGQDPQTRTMPKNPNEAFFVQVEVDKTEVYEGEPVTVNFYILTRGSIEQLDRVKFPDFKGFWKEDIEQAPSLAFSQEIVNGIAYRKALLASHALFPIKAGLSVVDEYKIKATVRLPLNGFGAFGFGQAYSYTKSSERIKINVKPLPVEGRPADFTGAVGDFQIDSHVEGKNFVTNQPFSLKVRFEGNGNAKLIELPKVGLPPSLELYDSKADSKFFKNGSSFKEFELLLIPRETGEIKIPPITFSLFDPKTKSYVTKATKEFTLQVGQGQAVPAAPQGSQLNLPEEASQAPIAKAKEKTLPPLVVVWSTPGLLAYASHPSVWLSFILFCLLLLVWKTRREFGWGQRQKSVELRLRTRIKKIGPLVNQGDYRRIGAEMTNVVYDIIGEVSGQGGAHKELDKLLSDAPPSVRRELGDSLKQLLEVFQIMSFAPESAVGHLKEPKIMKQNIKEMEKLLARAVALGMQ